MKLYVASSWRNEKYENILQYLRLNGVDHYNFRDANARFHWKEIDEQWAGWGSKDMIASLDHPLSEHAFKNDFDAMKECDACLLVHPCGRSAHLEAGWFVGQGKPLYILADSGDPDLMFKMATLVTDSAPDVLAHMGV